MRTQQLDMFAVAGFSRKRVAFVRAPRPMVSDLEYSDYGRDLETFPRGWWLLPSALPGLALIAWAATSLFG